MPLFRKKQTPSSSVAVHPRDIAGDEWSVSEGQMDGAPVIVRFNQSIAAAAGHPEYSIQMGVALPLLTPNPGGLPTPEEAEELNAIEDVIDRLVGDKAVMVAVVTTGEMREFVLYTGSGDWIAKFDADLQAAAGDHEVQVMAQTDPEWNVYASLAG